MRPIPRPKLWPWLLPLSWLYGGVTLLRNKAFDWGWLPQAHFDVPIINVGNLTVGGTGKTPHTEFLLQFLSETYRVATLSRGYGRDTKGFFEVTNESTAAECGDEPFQMKHKYPNVCVAVDEDRREGIQLLLKGYPKPEVIVLDDALQHRYITAGLNILLTDYSRLYTRDLILPAGRLRESSSGAKRAHIVIVTKCPEDLTTREAARIRRELHLCHGQRCFFTTFRYRHPYSVFGTQSIGELRGKSVLTITGIARPEPMLKQLEGMGAEVTPMTYPDHHSFSQRDIEHINETFKNFLCENGIVVTTEKDAARIIGLAGLSSSVKEKLFALPIEVDFLFNGDRAFKKIIYSYIDKP